jgi:CRP/FNR family cyclic AMP-dependent transcriptional regulator
LYSRQCSAIDAFGCRPRGGLSAKTGIDYLLKIGCGSSSYMHCGAMPMRQTETLARIQLFKTLDAAAIRRLDTQCVWQRFVAKECIVDYQDSGSHVFFVIQGHVRVLIRSRIGRESILREIREGEFFGELAAIDGLPRSASIVAIADSVVARMPPTIFRDSVHKYPDVCDQLLTLLASQLRMLANRVNEYGTLDVRARIYSELLRLARAARNGETSAVISPPPTHAELAARVSSHREAITRELNRMERAGLLQRRRGAMVIVDTARLAKLVEEAVC